MRKILNRMAVALAGLGLFAGSASSEAPTLLHDTVRHRVIDEVGMDEISPDAVRNALGRDPDFGLLLEYYQEKSKQILRGSHHAEDALQETLLRIWKGQPQLFLKPLDEVIRYFRTAIKHNAITEIQKETRHNGKTESDRVDMTADAHGSFRDPADEAASRDLFQELATRLSRTDLDVLDAYLSSSKSQRKITKEVGISRYAAARSTEKIKRALRTLLEERDGITV